jgi:hypothetical protein
MILCHNNNIKKDFDLPEEAPSNESKLTANNQKQRDLTEPPFLAQLPRHLHQLP